MIVVTIKLDRIGGGGGGVGRGGRQPMIAQQITSPIAATNIIFVVVSAIIT